MNSSFPDETTTTTATEKPIALRLGLLIAFVSLLTGLGAGYLLWGWTQPSDTSGTGSAAVQLSEDPAADLVRQINPPDGYALEVRYGDLGPRLLSSGAMRYDLVMRLFEQKGLPLTEAQQAILLNGSQDPIVFTRENADFLLSFFWAVGLVNQNRILTDGPMMQYGAEEIGRFASTGGWILGAKNPVELYASARLIELTVQQQDRLELVAGHVYRPCCNNPTLFPDCNHGMAMLGLLTLLASQDASEAEMFLAAKYANAFWFQQQTLEMALFFQAAQEMEFADVDAALLVGQDFSSGQGYGNVHNWLSEQGILKPAPGNGGSCGA